jgi:hypothetical protein
MEQLGFEVRDLQASLSCGGSADGIHADHLPGGAFAGFGCSGAQPAYADYSLEFGDVRNCGGSMFAFEQQDFPVGKPVMPGDYYRDADDIVKGITMDSFVPMAPLAGLDNHYDEMEIPQPMCCTSSESFQVVPIEERFNQFLPAPLEQTDPFFPLEEATTIRLSGMSPADAANSVLDVLSKRDGVAILKVRPSKYWLKAAACLDEGLSCEFKVFAYVASSGPVPATSTERDFGSGDFFWAGDSRQHQGVVLDFQRRGGCALAFAKIVNTIRATFATADAEEEMPPPPLPPLPATDWPIAEDNGVEPFVVTPGVVTAFHESSAGDSVDAYVSLGEEAVAKPLAPLIQSIARCSDDSETQAEVASTLQATVEGEPDLAPPRWLVLKLVALRPV